MKERVFRNWNFQRILFTGAGITIIIHSVIDRQWIGIIPYILR